MIEGLPETPGRDRPPTDPSSISPVFLTPDDTTFPNAFSPHFLLWIELFSSRDSGNKATSGEKKQEKRMWC
jgi:hypothetical protein